MLHPTLIETDYEKFAGRKVSLPAIESNWPSKDALATRSLVQ